MTARRSDSPHSAARRLAWVAAVRRLFVCLGIAALCLQFFAPDMAKAATMEWIEICSDDGVKVIAVDMSDGAPVPHQPCPKCDSCTFCALSLAALGGSPQPFAAPIRATLIADLPQDKAVLWQRRFIWPNTRGPPTAPQENKDRVFRAFPVSYSNKGEAL